ncbi:Regulator of sirC expression, contains transglutaminase-like and TPR domains [Pseudidiomarina planktonica]|uniref:Regulator of sirC expression, contains transglutaminase-like and TPR domains n=1 Tax=Pseudidiomarina planktonica TaxID=1323738 RepID=A0A1Y6EN46_9GAMM|nr:tetratricopeptide repeat protein [Pseudidiomarina planktonica]RUO65625.1 hypothetical protein CWI77_04025 [Pseudidiomarina planktonica]SMQ63997.1 Regulator of sirC expression, contains transglutaminase-like and TPR domains [Pseudidiomarina planktonica]
MGFSYLEDVEQEVLPTIEIMWEISRVFHSDSDHYVADFYKMIGQLAERYQDQAPAERLLSICDAFYLELGFTDAPEPVAGSRRILIDRVISLRTGLPVTLAFLLQEAASYAGLQLDIVDFPGYPLLRFDDNQQSLFIDPINGEVMADDLLQLRFEDMTDDSETFSWEMVEATPQKAVLVRYLSELKHAFINDEDFEQALIVVEMLLTVLPDDPYEIRDRGYVFEELDCQHIAVDDYQYFVEQCPDDPSAQLLRLQLEGWAAPQRVLH